MTGQGVSSPDPPSQWVPEVLSSGVKQSTLDTTDKYVCKMATHLHLMQRLRLCGAVPPLPLLHGVILI
jgi:hypothetical protein